MSDPKELVEEKTHIKQALHRNGYPAWLLDGADTPPPVQPAEEEDWWKRTPWTQHFFS